MVPNPDQPTGPEAKPFIGLAKTFTPEDEAALRATLRDLREEEVEAIRALHERFPDARVTLDPNGGDRKSVV